MVWLSDHVLNSYFKVNKKSDIEKRNFIQNGTCFIQRENGDIIYDFNAMTIEAKHSYENFYSSREHEILK